MLLRNSIPNTVRPSATDTMVTTSGKSKHLHTKNAQARNATSISHHHGIGKMFAPWLEGYIGEKEYGVFKVLKNYFDPKYNMNPGGTIGLDLLPEEKKFDREYTDYLAQDKFDK